MPLEMLELARLRFFLAGDEVVARTIHELLFRSPRQVVVRTAGGSESDYCVLGPEALAMVGFEQDEGMLPYDARSFVGYRLLTEFFTFPQKFLFWDLCGLDKLTITPSGADRIEILIYLDHKDSDLESRVRPEIFRLGCTRRLTCLLRRPIRFGSRKRNTNIV